MELLRDYAVRGHELEGMALFDFIHTKGHGGDEMDLFCSLPRKLVQAG
jgi:hypothetical protein